MKPKNMIVTSVFLTVILTLWVGVFLLLSPSPIQLPDAKGSYDLSDYNFQESVYTTASSWESWPEKLYTPEALRRAEAPVPQDSLDYTVTQYVTHRLRLILPPGHVYGISMYSTDYSMRLYINGVETDVVGNPGTTREETVPQMREGAYYFVTPGETTELVVQTANFVHKIGCYPPVLTIGTAEQITQYVQNANIKTGVVFGCLMTACLFHLAIFINGRRRVASLIFSVLCLTLSYISKDFPALLFAKYNWQLTIRLEYLACILAASALSLLVHVLFPTALHKCVLYCYLGACGGYSIIIILFDSLIFTHLLPGFQAISTAIIIYGIIRLAMTLWEKKLKNMLAFLGIAMLALFVILDFMQNSTVSAIGYTGMISAGMIFLVFCYNVVLSIEDNILRQRLDEVSRNEHEIRETNRMLERLNRAKTDFLGNISHEMKTPLAVISNCAGITRRQLRQNVHTKETEQNLDDMQHEAVRLGKLVEQLLAVSMEKERQQTLDDTTAALLLCKAADFCAPICRGRENKIELEMERGNIPLRVNTDGIFQVLVNLITNANRQIKNGRIILSVKVNEDKHLAVFAVKDNGSGIPPELLERVFQRGVSGDGSSGLGLSICEEIVWEHNGRMGIESSSNGTSVHFTLPCENRSGEDE